MKLLQFIGDHPWLTVILFLITISSIGLAFNRFCRVITIWKHGYPPPHCDADGDFPEKNEGKDA